MEGISHIGPYRIDKELARSNICTVYRAYEESLGRPVLIKKLHPQMAREDDIRHRFEREAQVCAQVKHDNIVVIYSYNADPDESMLVLEFVEGMSLAELIIQKGHLPWEVALTVLQGVLKGLSYAHEKGVIHRDIKPDNILISDKGQVKISDFGLATIEDAPRLTRQGMVVGTPSYMPPEQVSGNPVDQRSDLFSLGVTLYEALTAKTPFYGDNYSEIMQKILHAHPVKPSAVVAEIPSEFDQIILRLLEKQPTKRYATAEQVLEDVTKLASQKDVTLDPAVVRKFMLPRDEDAGVAKRKPSSFNEPAPMQTSFWKRKCPVWLPSLVGLIAIAIALLLPGPDELLDERTALLSPSLTERVKRTVEDRSRLPGRESGVLPVEEAAGREERATAQTGITSLTGEVASMQPLLESEAGRSDQMVPGWVYISSKPWSTVTIDNRDMGQTPLAQRIELSPGEHQIVFHNDQFPSPVGKSVIIEPESEQRLDVNLWEYFSVIRILTVKPWAEIFVDNVSYGQTPRAKPIILPLGSHTIELRNPDYKPWRKVVNFEMGDPAVEVSVALTPK